MKGRPAKPGVTFQRLPVCDLSSNLAEFCGAIGNSKVGGMKRSAENGSVSRCSEWMIIWTGDDDGWPLWRCGRWYRR